jgi:carotenoid cleavage dioxygenase
MPNASEPQSLRGDDAPVLVETTVNGLTATGAVPRALAGQFVRIGPNSLPSTVLRYGRSLDGMVHAVSLVAGLGVSYRSRWVNTDNVAHSLGTDQSAGPAAAPVDSVATNVITFGGRIFALGPGALAYELDEHLATVRRVDLAGRGRGIGAHPQLDPQTGALHLVSYGDEPAHHIVSPNSQTRTTFPITDAPGPLDDPLLTQEHIVLLGDGFVGVTDRTGQVPPRWCDARITGTVAAHDCGGAVAVLAADRFLVRWTIDGAGARREVLDDTPQRFGTTNPQSGSVPRFLWAVAAASGTEVYRHDLRTGDRTAHDLGPGRHSGAMSFVPDPARLHREDGGWIIGFAHDDNRKEADLIVLDAAAIDRPPVATVAIPQRIPYGRRGAWIPAS